MREPLFPKFNGLRQSDTDNCHCTTFRKVDTDNFICTNFGCEDYLPPDIPRPGLGRERYHILSRAAQLTLNPHLIQNHPKQIVQPPLLP